MWETVRVTLTVTLPKDIAAQAEEVQNTDPEFLSKVVLYGITRRLVYQHLRQNTEDAIEEMKAHVFTDHERAILEENAG